MGIYKKIVGSITIIAIGCALLFPIKTMADGVNCMGFHKYKEIDTKYSQKTTTHPYLFGIIEQEDGTEEYVYQDCIITTTVDTIEKECSACKKILTQEGVGEKRVHSKYIE